MTAARPGAPAQADRDREGARRRAVAGAAAGPPGRQSQGPDRPARAGHRGRARAPRRPPRRRSRRPEGEPRGAERSRPAVAGDRLRLGQGHAAAAGQRHQDSRVRRARRPRRNRKGPFGREPRRRPGHGALRRLGGLCGTVPFLRTTLDPECRRRISCAARGDGADFGRSRPVRADRGARCGDGGRAAVGRRHRDRLEPTGSVHRVSQGRDSRRSRPMVGGNRQRKGSRMIRKTSSDPSRRSGRRGGDALRHPAADAAVRLERQGRGRRHLPAAQSVRRRVRARARRLRREAGRRQADRVGDQRHAQRARSAFELHGPEELPRHAGADPRRVRRARHRSHDGRRPRQGRRRRSTTRPPPRPASWRTTSSPSSTTSRCRA